jgi:hypothetical protein
MQSKRNCIKIEIFQRADIQLMFQVIDPQNYQPFFRYNDNIIHADDLEDLMEDGFLRVVELF